MSQKQASNLKALVEKKVDLQRSETLSHCFRGALCQALKSEGLVTLDEDKHFVRPHGFVWEPRGIRHSATNTAVSGPVFLMLARPANEQGGVL